MNKFPCNLKILSMIFVFLVVLTFSLIWASVVPLGGEGPDEPEHLAVIAKIVRDRQLPVFDANEIVFNQAAFSNAYYPMTYNSPLNYLFFLPLAEKNNLNPNAKSLLNYRFVSSLLLALFALFLFLALAKAKPKSLPAAIVTTLFISLIPQVIFSGGYLNIEPVALLFSAVSFYCLMVFFEKNNCSSSLLLGFSLGLLALCKVNYLLWLAVVLILAIYRTFSFKSSIREKLIKIALVVSPILLLNLYWWIRNYQLYGDPLIFGYIISQINKSAPDWFRPPVLAGHNLVSLLFETNFARNTYLGFFAALGGVAIFLPLGVYFLFYALLFLPVIIALYLSYHRQEGRFLVTFLFLTSWLFLIYFAHKNLYDFSPQGRHLFPLLPIFAWLVYLGLSKIKWQPLLVIYLLFPVVSSFYALWWMVDRFYVKGDGYVIPSNFGHHLADFRWRHLNYSALRRLLDYILAGNPTLFSLAPVIVYCLIFLLSSLMLARLIIKLIRPIKSNNG